MTLPAPRNLLTSLFAALAAPSSAPTPADSAPAPNPLRNIPEEKAALLSALHVIFPSLLLPALDLLDRGLVTGVRTGHGAEGGPRASGAAGSNGRGETGGGGGEAGGAEESEGAERADAPEGRDGAEMPGADLYVVRSLASTMRRVGREREGRCYLVTLRAWNCTCPSFTLDAFPPAPSANPRAGQSEHATGDGTIQSGGSREAGEGALGVEGGGQGEDGSWSFGGTSADGLSLGGPVPCCKHLLACVLAERWGAVLGSYVPVKAIRKSEVAGLVAHV